MPAQTLELKKNGASKKMACLKKSTSRTNILQIVSGHMKGNAKLIYFLMKSRGEQGIVVIQITFEKCTASFYFQNTVAFINIYTYAERLRMFILFYAASISIKTFCLSRVLDSFSRNC